MADKEFDLVIIGAGPGGYVCAIRAAQLGMKVACLDKRGSFGGTCLNVGCIPSKALLAASEKYAEAKHHLADFGVETGKVSLDLKKMMAHKDSVVKDNTAGIEFLFKKNKVEGIVGSGEIKSKDTIEVTNSKGEKTTIKAKNIVIATGSEVSSLPGIDIDEKRVVSSTGALKLSEVPKKMVVIGGGVIGLEMGAVWSRLGADVTVVEYLDRILPGMDGEVSKTTKKILEKQGIKFKLATKVTEVKASKKDVSLKLEAAAGGDEEALKTDIVLVAVGRRPYVDGLGLEHVGVKLDERGRIDVDAHFKTNIDGIYAIGDVIKGAMLAHKAEDEGVVLAEQLAGIKGHINYDAIPGIVYTSPEVASVGKTEEELKQAGVAYKVGKFPFSANGRARAMNATDGFVKILADKETDKVLGGHIVGIDGGHLIAEIATVIEYGGTAEDIALTCHAHPTLSEVVKEAALAVDGRPLHM